jgi:hypothetical protein
MAGFSVDTDAVQAFGREIAQVCADLESAALPSDLSDDAAGSREVGQALREFHSHWRDQQDQLLGSLQALSAAVHDAADSYDRSDQAVSSATDGDGAA